MYLHFNIVPLAVFISSHIKAMALLCISVRIHQKWASSTNINHQIIVICAMWGKPQSCHVKSCSTPTHEHKHLARVLSPLPPFMWNGSLPADKSIGFALRTPTCDNKRLYRQPTAWKHGAALQLEAKVHISKGWKGEWKAVTKSQTWVLSVDYAYHIKSIQTNITRNYTVFPFTCFEIFLSLVFKK